MPESLQGGGCGVRSGCFFFPFGLHLTPPVGKMRRLIKSELTMALYSAGVEYGIHCMLWLADDKGDSREASVRTLAELQGVPQELLAKIFTRLAKAQLVVATAGVRGGFKLARPSNEISMLDIVRAIDGEKSIFDCRNVRE